MNNNNNNIETTTILQAAIDRITKQTQEQDSYIINKQLHKIRLQGYLTDGRVFKEYEDGSFYVQTQNGNFIEGDRETRKLKPKKTEQVEKILQDIFGDVSSKAHNEVEL